MRALLAVPLVLAACLLGPAPAAHAAGVVSTSDGVLYDDCQDHAYSYSFTLPPETDSWSLDVAAVAPDGTTEVTDFDYGSGGLAVGTGGLQFCGFELPGTYQLQATVEYDDYSSGVTGIMTASAVFSMRTPYSRTTLKVSDRSPRFNQPVRFVMKARDERPSGYFPTEYATIRLEVRARGTWHRIRGGQVMSDSKGRAVVAYRWDLRRALWLRAVTKAGPSYAGSKSSPVRVG
jgi:hypothetical protein